VPLAPDTLLLVRGNVQLADRALVPIEQFSLGGLESVRGYRQDYCCQIMALCLFGGAATGSRS